MNDFRCAKCGGELNETPIKFDNKYWCNFHIPNKYFNPKYDYLVDKEQVRKNLKRSKIEAEAIKNDKR